MIFTKNFGTIDIPININKIYTIYVCFFFFFCIPELCLSDVVINEIMYNPSGNENYTEYIELYNDSPYPTSLERWMISDGDQDDEIISLWPDSSLILQPYEFAIIIDSGYLENGEGYYDEQIPAGVLLFTTPDAAIGSGGLSNSNGEIVSLYSQDHILISQRHYRIGAEDGVSEERIRIDEGEMDSNWTFSAPGGTPGFLNSASPRVRDLAIDSVVCEWISEDLESFEHIHYFAYIHNVGISHSSADSLRVLMDIFLPGHMVLVSQWPIPQIESGAEISFEDWIVNPTPGIYRVQFSLTGIDENPVNDTLSTSVRVPTPGGAVRFSELMIDPPDSVPLEWVEVTNTSDESLSLQGCFWRDATGGTASVDTIPNEIYRLEPDSFLVIAKDSTIFNWSMIERNKVIIATGWTPLNNDTDTLVLFDVSGNKLDSVIYYDPPENRSLIRTAYTNSPHASDWTACLGESPGTPGYASTGNTNPEDSNDSHIQVQPNPFSPDGDGHEDLIAFQFNYPAAEIQVTLTVYDVNGRYLGKILENQRFNGVSSYQWDGHSGLNSRLRVGIYPFHVSVRSITDGRQWEERGTFVCAGSTN